MNVLISPDQKKDPGKELAVPAHLQQYLAPWSTPTTGSIPLALS